MTWTNLLSINRKRRLARAHLKNNFVAHRQKEEREGGTGGGREKDRRDGRREKEKKE